MKDSDQDGAVDRTEADAFFAAMAKSGVLVTTTAITLVVLQTNPCACRRAAGMHSADGEANLSGCSTSLPSTEQ